MATTHKIYHAPRINSANNPLWMDGLRVILGLFLFFKGVLFAEHITDVFFVFGAGEDILPAGKAHLLVGLVHIIGGLMIAFGFLTRLALLCQFPIIIGTLLIVSPQRGAGIDSTEIVLSVIVVGLLLFFMIVGPGRYSVDNKILRQKQTASEG